jgi:HAE1 family hydrophobic/amphiphilic exporter-1
MFSKFFIERPVLANVLAIVMMLLGATALFILPVAQYPDITPPTVTVSTSYPGASPEVVAETVAAPIEQQINGVEKMLYMSSKSASDGSYCLTITFEVGTDLDTATVLVLNRVNSAMSTLPQPVQSQGVQVQKKSTAILMVISLNSPNGTYDDLFLSNYATLQLKDELSRLDGVGAVNIYGADEYGMRVWLDPEKLKSLNLTAQDVVNAISQQNLQVASGQLGQAPVPDDQAFQLTIKTLGRLADVGQFENIIVKTDFNQTGKVVRVKDLARVELGAKTYDLFGQKNGKPAACMCIYLLPGANALKTADLVNAKMAELAKSFPQDFTYQVPVDTTRFVNAAIHQVYETLIEAAVLVLVVIMVFLQNWRAMLVPATTVPVTILGAFIAMVALGFSVNLITLFGIVLAIGIVVDDAIIVVEGAMHNIERGMNPKNSAIQAMAELFGPIIGITLVLISVFLPAACMPGITGQLYRQFALVIAATAVISAINAATLKPTQCALWLRPAPEKKNAFYRGFNAVYGRVEAVYEKTVRLIVGHSKLVMIGYVGVIALTMWIFSSLPTGFLPEEDQGYCIISTQLPPAASQPRTREVAEKINDIVRDTPGVADWVNFGGLSILDGVNQSNMLATFVVYKDWSLRGKGETQEDILAHLQGRLRGIREAMAFVFVPPAIQGLGQAGGFEMVIQDKTNPDPMELNTAIRDMVLAGRGQGGLAGLSATYSASTPQIWLDVNRTQVLTYSVDINDLFSTLQTNLGSAYVNQFNKFGRVYQVRVQADAPFRRRAADIRDLEVRNKLGKMVPVGALASVKDVVGPPVLTRYNLYMGASVYGSAAPGFSSGQAMNLMEQMAKAKLPNSMGFDWTGMSFQEKRVGSQAYFIFAFAVLLVYLVLAAKYESWFLPTSVILVVPLALLGTAVAVFLRGMENDVYTQIGVVLLISLASKNAILIVEFARELRSKGRGLQEAAIEAAKLRFRPILMTSFAFILGVVPLLEAHGAGGASQRAVGTAVFGGMIASTLLAVLVVPVFYVIVQGMVERFFPPKAEEEPQGD